jgi:dTDP-4-amino-4,6-dideoxygalactose transaminase
MSPEISPALMKMVRFRPVATIRPPAPPDAPILAEPALPFNMAPLPPPAHDGCAAARKIVQYPARPASHARRHFQYHQGECTMAKLAIAGGAPLRTRPFPRYPFYGPAVKDAVCRVYESQELCSMSGRETPAFEAEYAAWHGVGHAVASSNGTTSLQVALAALDIGCGDEVLVPAYTYIATASAVVTQNAIPVLVDAETRSFGLDPAEMERKITSRTRAVMPVHLNGYPCDMDAVMALAEKHDLRVVEDCSHAHGALHRGRKVGTLGDIGVFSLQGKKNLSVGEGGIAVTRSAELAEKMRQIRHFSERPMKYNYRMTEFHAAVGRAQLALLDEMNDTRRRNAARLVDRLQDLDGLTPLAGLPDTVPVYYNCVFCFDEDLVGVSRGRFADAVMAEGIPLNIFYYPLNRDSILKAKDAFGRGCPFSCPYYEGDADYTPDDNPVATHLCDHVSFEIKVHPPCTEDDMDDMAAAVRKVYENVDEIRPAPETAS